MKLSKYLTNGICLTHQMIYLCMDHKNSFHGVTQMGLKPHQKFFQKFFSTNMVARVVQSFCKLEGATDPQIEKKI